MNMPLRRFWFLSDCINRIRAEQDTRALSIALSSQSGEAAREVQNHLTIETGTIYVQEAVRDEDARSKLMALQ